MPIVVLGSVALAGYVTVRRALDSTVDTADVDPAIDVTAIESAVEEDGLGAVTDTETLEAAINDDELDAPIDTQRLQSSVEETVAPIEEAVETGGVDSVLSDEDLDAVGIDTVDIDGAVSAITEQEVLEGTIENDEVGVSIDVDELRSALERGAATLERTTATLAEKIDAGTDGSMLEGGREEFGDDGQRIAVVDERGRLDSILDETEPDTAADSASQSIEIDEPDEESDDAGSTTTTDE